MPHQCRLETRRPDLFFALDDDFDVDRKPAARSQVRFDCGEMHEHLALVVDRAAAVDIAAAHFGFKRRALPKRERIDGLHVVVPVDQHRRLSRRAEPLAVGERVAAGLEQLRL